MRLQTSLAAATLAAPAALAEIPIGSSLSVTGPASFLGDPELKTLEMLVERINEAGGVNGEPIRLIHYDDGGDANKARTFATRLIEDDEVVAVVGGSTTGTTMAMAPLFNDYEVPLVSLAGAVVIIDPVQEFVFKTPHTDRMACEKIFTDMQARDIARVGMISGQDGFGASMREQCLAVVGDYGLEVVADETYGPSDADMTPQLTRIRNTDAEAVLVAGFGEGPAIVARNYAQLGIELPQYQSHGVASDAFVELVGAEAAEGIRLPGTALLIAEQLPEDDPQHGVVTEYRNAYMERYGEEPSTFAGYAHDGLMLVVNAIERAGSTDPVDIRDALEATEGYVGVTGEFDMGPDDHMGLDLSAFRMLEIRDGGWTLVE